ncbi:MAG: hypothetical protein ACREJQ_07290 [bacterium]
MSVPNSRTAAAQRHAMAESLRGYWLQAESYQKFLSYVGALLVASAVFHFVVLLVTRGSWAGPVSWRKPILFGEAFGLTACSIAWFMTFLPKRPVAGWVLSIALGIANFGEVLWVSIQQWRGAASHFNNSTPFDAAAFAAAGFLILFAAVVILIVTLASFSSLSAPPSLSWAIRAGLLLLLTSQVLGLLMINNDGPVFGSAGSMKLPHAFALHAAQVLPALAWLMLFSAWNEPRQTRAVMIGTVGYAGVVGVSTRQALVGLALFDVGGLPACVLAFGALALVGSYAAAILALFHAAGEVQRVR